MKSHSSPTAATILSIASSVQSQAPAALEQELNSVVGVVEHGLFLNMTSRAMVAGQDGVKVLLPQSPKH